MQTVTLIAPEHWAPAIVNLDYSGLSPDDLAACNTFLAENGLSSADCLDCQEVGFMRRHDASSYTGAAQCAAYTFRK